MSIKGMLRRIRKNGQGMEVWLPGNGTMVLKGLHFRSARELKSYHDAKSCEHNDNACYQASEPDTQYRYIGDHCSSHLLAVMKQVPGAFARILNLDHNKVAEMVRHEYVPES
jgi:hypothetical protein